MKPYLRGNVQLIVDYGEEDPRETVRIFFPFTPTIDPVHHVQFRECLLEILRNALIEEEGFREKAAIVG
jgi:hypothetical protein